MFDENKVAILIPLYNDAPNIARAIRSAVEQKVPDSTSVEVIVVDDCSTDNGPDIAENMAATLPNLKVIRQAQNAGPSAARNCAVQQTNAAWFTPLDSDDFMTSSRISDLLMEARTKDLDWVADNLLMSSEDTPEEVERVLWPDKPEGDVRLTTELFVNQSYATKIERSELGFIKPLIHRRCLGDTSRPYRDELRFGEDFELYTRLLMSGAKADLVDAKGYYLVRRKGSASHSQSGRDHQRLVRINREMLKYPGLTHMDRRAILGHLKYSERELAWWKMIEAVREKNPVKAFGAMMVSPTATLHVIGNLARQLGERANRRRSKA
ncbi:MAG: glycosyltransferase [Hyphomonas sp.]|jgi:glycosyltransferase involved in cell wall biosynthesis|uniref:glycosyltransferase family 2 protein n=2 Tax=Hyphomonas sp. TaxID=87 RepID=UPI00326304F6